MQAACSRCLQVSCVFQCSHEDTCIYHMSDAGCGTVTALLPLRKSGITLSNLHHQQALKDCKADEAK